MIKLFFTTSLFFLLSASFVSADFTSWYYPSSASSVDNKGFNIPNIQASDDVRTSHSFSPSDANSNAQGFLFDDLPELSAYEYISAIWVEVEGYKSITTPGTNINYRATIVHDDLGYDSAQGLVNTEGSNMDYSDDELLPHSTDDVITMYFSNNDPDTGVSDYFETYTYDPDTLTLYLDDNGFSGSNAPTVYIDMVRMRFFISEIAPTVSVGSGDASPSAQLATLSWTGDTVVSGSDVTCKVSVHESCQKTGYAGWTSETPVATVWLQDNGNTETVYRGGNEYEGYGWSDGDSLYSVDNVSVPYNPGFDCEYPTHTVCYDSNSNILIQGDSGVIDPGDDFFQEITDPEPDDPLQWIFWKLKQLISQYILPTDTGKFYYQQFYNQLTVKAPFAYALAVYNTDFSSITEENIPSLSIPVQETNSFGIPTTIEWSDDGTVENFLSIFRAAITVMLWITFVIYLVFLGRRII